MNIVIALSFGVCIGMFVAVVMLAYEQVRGGGRS